MALAWVAFVGGGAVSLATSWLLVTRLERIGERVGLSEALLGVVAALAADAPEVTSSVTALTQHQRAIGAGVVIGSNAFNVASLLGLGAIVSGFIALHRRVVLLGGVVAVAVAGCCVAAATGLATDGVALAAAAVIMGVYLVVLGVPEAALQRFGRPRRLTSWLTVAVHEEELELATAIRPAPGDARDVAVAAGALVAVVLASVAMERGATQLGHRWHLADAVIGGVVLAAVTSLPNAVAGVRLAATGRGAAAWSTALNSNNLNVLLGLLVPGVFVGLAAPSAAGDLTVWAYLVLTTLVTMVAYRARGLRRRPGVVIVAAYVLFIAALVARA